MPGTTRSKRQCRIAEQLNLHQRRCGKFRYQNISVRTYNEDIRQLAMEPLRCVETSDTDHETTRHHVPEKGMPQMHLYGSHKPHI